MISSDSTSNDGSSLPQRAGRHCHLGPKFWSTKRSLQPAIEWILCIVTNLSSSSWFSRLNSLWFSCVFCLTVVWPKYHPFYPFWALLSFQLQDGASSLYSLLDQGVSGEHWGFGMGSLWWRIRFIFRSTRCFQTLVLDWTTWGHMHWWGSCQVCRSGQNIFFIP